MNPDEAQAALDDIHKRHEQSRAEEARHAWSPVYLLVAVSVLFLSFASFDLPNPWGGAMLFPVVALLVLLVMVYLRRAPVLRKPRSAEAPIWAAFGILLVAVFQGVAAAVQAAGLPIPHVIAAAVTSGVFLLATGRVCAVAAARARQATARRN